MFSPSMAHPLGDAASISHVHIIDNKLAITAYAMRHAPTESSDRGKQLMWLRTFDRNGGQIPPSDWRSRTLRLLNDDNA